MAETFEVVVQFDERAEVGEASDLTFHYVAGLVRCNEALPGVRLKVFD